MLDSRSTTEHLKRYSGLLWLGLAIVFLLFSNGRYLIFIATWLAPVFFIRYLRSSTLVVGLISGLLVNVVVTIVTWRGMIPVPGAAIFLVGSLFGTASFLPYFIDRVLYKAGSGFSGTLIFPCVWVGFEYINSLFNPYATWGSLAYTQFEAPLALLQQASVIGIWGISFFITWFAAVINWAWENHFSWKLIRQGLCLYLGSGLLIGGLGSVKLAFFAPGGPTVRVASIVSPFEWNLAENITQTAKLTALRKTSQAVQSELLNLSRQAALANADIIIWNEAAAPVFKPDEKAFIQKAGRLAEELGVYLLMSLYTRPANYPDQSIENKVVLLDSDGNVSFEYFKAKPVPGEDARPGFGQLKAAVTPFGKIASMICFDMDFPILVSQAGRGKVDLMLVPADDWRDINPIHTHMASLRAIENGFSLVRSTKEGLSAAFDYHGRLVASLDDFNTEKRILFADLPVNGVFTIYPYIGDLFAWFCMAGLAVLVLWGRIQNIWLQSR